MRAPAPKVRATASLTVRRREGATGRITRATVLFADLRGFTGLAERLAPTQILTLLDEFFGVLAESATAHGGTVYHMAGDGMMAGFGGTGAADSGASGALAAGHAMLQRFASLGSRWRSNLAIDTGIGVGLHLGEVAMGALGPPGQKTMTLVGDTVNVAARLCGRARAGEVLLSYAVAAALDIADGANQRYVGPIPVLHLPQYALRGRAAPLDIWCIPAGERVAFQSDLKLVPRAGVEPA